MPRSSAETRAVCRVPRKPRCVTETPGKWPSAVRLVRCEGSKCGIVKNGLDARLVSHVKILPFACPPAIVVWSAEMAMAVIGPDSTAISCQYLVHQHALKLTFGSWANNHFQVLVIIKHKYYSLGRSQHYRRRHSKARRRPKVSLSRFRKRMAVEFPQPSPAHHLPRWRWRFEIGLVEEELRAERDITAVAGKKGEARR